MSKHILFIVNSIKNGGAERVCVNMADTCVKLGYSVDFVTISRCDKTISNNLINYYCLNYNLNSKFEKIKCLLFGHKKLNKIIKKNIKMNGRYDLITSHLPVANIVTRFSCVSKQCIYVLHSTLDIFGAKNQRLFAWCLRRMFGKCKIVCVSKGVASELMQKYGLSWKKLKVIYNPIDEDKIRKDSLEKCDYKRPYLLLVGRFNSLKRFDRAVDIFRKGRFYKKYDLVFCGVGELENEIKDKVKRDGLEDNVVFLGWQDNVYKWMKNADLLLCTSDHEGFPMNLVEAFACGTKVVSGDCDYGPSEILIDDFKKYLVEIDNIESYVEKIRLALKVYPKERNPILDKCNSEHCVRKYLAFAKERI